MSRLYGLLTSDTRQKAVTTGAHREVTAVLRYGSSGNSMEAVSVSVLFNPDSEEFRLLVDVPGVAESSYLLADGQAVKELWKVERDE